MVRNKTGGNKTKGKGRKFSRPKTLNIEDLKKIDGQEYAYVKEKYGGGRFKVICYDKIERMAIMRGKLKRMSGKLNAGGLILVSLRGFQDDKCDILEVYKSENIDKLIEIKEITSSFAKEGKLQENIKDDIDYIQFGNKVNNESEEEEETSVNVDTQMDWLTNKDKYSNKNNENDIGINIDDI